MRILVTGGAGFIGSHLVDALIARGHRVTVLDNLSASVSARVHPRAKFIRMDLRNPRLAVTVRRLRPEFVFHFAAQIDPRLSLIDPEFDADVNIVGSIRLLEAVCKAKVKRFIFSSSGGAIYGGATKLPTPEEHPAHPFSPYGVSKLAFEQYLYCYGHVYGLSYAALRYANVYGPRQGAKGEAGVIAIFIKKMLRGEQPIVYGDGKQTRDFVYVDDVVRANLLALKSGVRGVFNIGTGKETSINQIFLKLRALTGAQVVKKHGPAKLGEERRSILDARKAGRELGWKPQVSLEQGLRKTVAWFHKER